MKKIYLTSFIIGGMLAFASCEGEEVPITSDDFNTVINYKESGDIIFNYYTVGNDVTQTIIIGKGGYDLGAAPQVTLTPYTQEELDKYNANNDTDYKLIPPEYYTLPTTVGFASEDMYKTVDFVLKGTFDDLAVSGGEYILPVQLNTNVGSVNENNSLICLKPNILIPAVMCDRSGVQMLQMKTDDASTTSQTFEYELALDIQNKWNFSVGFETDRQKLQEAVDAYNAANGVNYTLLNGYTLPSSVDFTPGENYKNLSVTITRGSLDAGDYLLPIITTGVKGMIFDIEMETNYIHLFIYEDGSSEIKLGAAFGEDVQATIQASNELSYQSARYLYDGITNDGDLCWHSEWWDEDGDGNTNVFDEKYGIYLDVNLKDPISRQLSFNYWTRAEENNKVPAHIQIYAGTNEGDLRMIGEVSTADAENPLATGAGKKYTSDIFSLSGIEATFLRFAILTSCDGNSGTTYDLRGSLTITDGSVAMGEFELFGK